MKRTKALILLAVFTAAIALASCKSSSKCPAYGEKKKYQIEVAY